MKIFSFFSFDLTYFISITSRFTYPRAHLSPLALPFEAAGMLPSLHLPKNTSYETHMAYTIDHCCPLHTSDVGFVTDVCNFDFHAIGNLWINKRYPGWFSVHAFATPRGWRKVGRLRYDVMLALDIYALSFKTSFCGSQAGEQVTIQNRDVGNRPIVIEGGAAHIRRNRK